MIKWSLTCNSLSKSHKIICKCVFLAKIIESIELPSENALQLVFEQNQQWSVYNIKHILFSRIRELKLLIIFEEFTHFHIIFGAIFCLHQVDINKIENNGVSVINVNKPFASLVLVIVLRIVWWKYGALFTTQVTSTS